MTKKTISVGVVGCGNFCKNHHLPILTEKMTDRYRLVGVCDAMPALAKEVSEQTGAPMFESFEKLLAEAKPELVHIVTRPPTTHYALAKAALLAGVNVLTAKPMCANAEECDELIEIAREKKLVLTVEHNRRWEIPFLLAKRVMEEGHVGKPYYVLNNHPTIWRGPADLLMDWGVHIADQALQLGGDAKPVEVSCMVVNPEEADHNSGPWRASIRFDNNLLIDLFQLLTAPGALPQYLVCGLDGSCTVKVKENMKEQNCSLDIELPGIQRGREGEDSGPISFKFDLRNYHELLYESIVNGAALTVPPEEARNAVVLCNLMAESARCQKVVVVDSGTWL